VLCCCVVGPCCVGQVAGPFTWTMWTEPVSQPSLPFTTTTAPAEQLSVTFDETEYALCGVDVCVFALVWMCVWVVSLITCDVMSHAHYLFRDLWSTGQLLVLPHHGDRASERQRVCGGCGCVRHCVHGVSGRCGGSVSLQRGA
jgi:hypothetical protein